MHLSNYYFDPEWIKYTGVIMPGCKYMLPLPQHGRKGGNSLSSYRERT